MTPRSLEFRLVQHFVLIETDNGDAEEFIQSLFRRVLKTTNIQTRTINIVVAYPGTHALNIWQDVLPPLAQCTRIRYNKIKFYYRGYYSRK